LQFQLPEISVETDLFWEIKSTRFNNKKVLIEEAPQNTLINPTQLV